jgi:hypothetical protein
MRIAPLLRRIGFVLILLAIPTLLGVRFRWDAILPVIIYLQLILIWAQAEIALRQHSLFGIQFKPFFGISYKRVITVPPEHSIWIRNASGNVAYNIMVGRLLDKQNKPIPPAQWKDKLHSDLISSLAPEEEALLCSLNEELAGDEFTIEFSYSDQLGELGTMYIKLVKDGRILLIPERREPPGILLNTFEYFALFFKFVGFRRRYRR